MSDIRSSDNGRLPNRTIDTLRELRQEAESKKECVTRYCFQGVLLATAVLGICARFLFENPWVALVSPAVLLLLSAVARIAIYKYQTAHRIIGYELHTYRTVHSKSAPSGWNKESGWHPSMMSIGWEEAMRAWRVIQPTLYERIYRKGLVGPKLRPEFSRARAEWEDNTEHSGNNPQYGLWWIPSTLIPKEAMNHTGSFLRKMLGLLHIVGLVCLASLFTAACTLLIRSGIFLPTPLPPLVFDGPDSIPHYLQGFAMLVIAIFGTAYWAFKVSEHYKKERLLADEILSIHSCAVLWEAVIVAHFRALASLESDDLRGYTYQLGLQAIDLCSKPTDIHRWISGSAPDASDA